MTRERKLKLLAKFYGQEALRPRQYIGQEGEHLPPCLIDINHSIRCISQAYYRSDLAIAIDLTQKHLAGDLPDRKQYHTDAQYARGWKGAIKYHLFNATRKDMYQSLMQFRPKLP